MSGTISVKLITSANPDGEVLTTGNAATKIAASTNDATTIIEATFTGTGNTNASEELTKATINASFDDYDIDNTSIENRTLKVKVVNYNGIFNAFSTMDESSKLNIVDLSGMVKDDSKATGTQGLDGFAFSGCTNLREITLFPNCEDIETNAFSDCGNLLKIYEIPSGMTAVTSGINTIFGGNENANTIAIFDIALSITGRGQVGSSNASAATISYSPVSAPAPEIIVQTYNVTATAILIDETDHQASIIFSETVNSKPVITSSAFNVAENQTTVGTVTATDADGNTSFTYSIVGSTNDNDKFSIVQSTGALTFQNAPNFESQGSAASSNAYIVTVGVNDGTTTVTENITVNVTNLNETPTFSSSTRIINVFENETTVGTVTATDPDSGTTLTYSITGGADAGSFNIDSSSGALTFQNAPNFESPGSAATPPSNSYIVIVTANDGINIANQTITVNVKNVNDNPPQITSSATFTPDENQLSIGQVDANDADGDLNTLTYSVSGSELAISSTGVLTFVTEPDYETKSTYTATVTVSDGINSTTQDITVTVQNLNDKTPSITSSATFTPDENQLSIGQVDANDADGDLNTLTYSVSGSELAISSTGLLTFINAPDYERKSTYTATVTVSDGTNSAIQDITVNVRDVVETFRPATKDALQTAIDKWYELANIPPDTTSSSSTTSTSESDTIFTLNDGSEKTRTDTILTANTTNQVLGVGVGKRDKLVSLVIGTKVTKISDRAFPGCNKLQSVTFDGTSQVASIGGSAFSSCSGLKSVTIPDSVTSIGEGAFGVCSELQSVTIGNSVTSIGNEAFLLCRKLQSLTIPDSVTFIGQGENIGDEDGDGDDDGDDGAFVNSAIQTLYMTKNNGLGLSSGEQTVGGKTVNVILLTERANNYNGEEYKGNPNTWDTSLIEDLSYVFFKKDQDNHPDISTWNVSNVTSMQGTFSNSTFNGELKNWNVASVTDFSYTFANNVVFNQELKRWNVQDATTMKSMFDNAYSFNQTIEPPMVQNKDGTDFPTQLTWDEDDVNGYLTTIYGEATPQTNPTTFKGVFGMIALLKKTYLDNIPTNRADGGKYNTIKESFSEVISELITNQQEILKYNYTYDETDGWTKTDPSIYFANTNGKTGDDLNEAKDSLNQLRLNTIVYGMLLINKAYDIAKSLGETDYSDLIEKMKNIYDDVYNNLPFYVAWYAPLLTTKANFLNNAFTFHNGATDGNIETKLTDFIDKNPMKTINGNTYLLNDIFNILFFSSADLYQYFANEYNDTSSS